MILEMFDRIREECQYKRQKILRIEVDEFSMKLIARELRGILIYPGSSPPFKDTNLFYYGEIPVRKSVLTDGIQFTIKEGDHVKMVKIPRREICVELL